MRITVTWVLALACGGGCLAQPIPEMRPLATPTPQPAAAQAIAATAQGSIAKLADATVGLQIKYVRDSAE